MLIYTIILALIALSLIIILILLKIKKKAVKNEASSSLLKQIKGSKKTESPKESLNHLNKLAKTFFKSYLKAKNELTFKEMSDILHRKKEENLAEFCEKMEYYLYSGKEITKSEALSLIDHFIAITKSHKIKTDIDNKKE